MIQFQFSWPVSTLFGNCKRRSTSTPFLIGTSTTIRFHHFRCRVLVQDLGRRCLCWQPTVRNGYPIRTLVLPLITIKFPCGSTRYSTNSSSSGSTRKVRGNNPPTSSSSRSWIDSHLPLSVQPYAKLARLDKPVGTMLLLWPCTWSTVMAAAASASSSSSALGLLVPTTMGHVASFIGLFTVGSFAMRGAGCIINDMWDKRYDAKVERTKHRPLASGELQYHQATYLLISHLSLGLTVLYYLPSYAIAVSLASMPLVITYPLMKRYTHFPQFILGLTFNWGVLVGWAAVQNTLLHPSVPLLYASGVAWTLIYDTLYAHQDKKDDIQLGLKSTAIYFGDTYTKPILSTLATVAFGGWCAAGYYAGLLVLPTTITNTPEDVNMLLATMSYTSGCTLAYSHLLWQIYTANLNDPSNLAHRFQSNNHVGAILFLTILTASTIHGKIPY
jgi:4-hydroxybenzoate polyprenyltransferase